MRCPDATLAVSRDVRGAPRGGRRVGRRARAEARAVAAFRGLLSRPVARRSRSPAACTSSSRAERREPRLQVGRAARRSSATTSSGSRPAQPAMIDERTSARRSNMARHPGRRLLRPALRERLLRVPARRRPRALDARRPVGRPELDPLARQHLQRGRRRCTSIRRRAASSSSSPTRSSRRSRARRQRIREALQVPEPDAHEVLGTADLPRRHRAAAARLRRQTISYPVNYIQGHFWLGAPEGFDAAETSSARVDEGQLPAHDRRDLPAPDAVLRRLVRGELGERRAVRRRDHERADPGDREALPRDREPWARCSPADRPAGGNRSRCRSSIPTSSAARGRRAPTR